MGSCRGGIDSGPRPMPDNHGANREDQSLDHETAEKAQLCKRKFPAHSDDRRRLSAQQPAPGGPSNFGGWASTFKRRRAKTIDGGLEQADSAQKETTLR